MYTPALYLFIKTIILSNEPIHIAAFE